MSMYPQCPTFTSCHVNLLSDFPKVAGVAQRCDKVHRDSQRLLSMRGVLVKWYVVLTVCCGKSWWDIATHIYIYICIYIYMYIVANNLPGVVGESER